MITSSECEWESQRCGWMSHRKFVVIFFFGGRGERVDRRDKETRLSSLLCRVAYPHYIHWTKQTRWEREKITQKSIQWILQFTRRISPHFSRCRCCCVVSSMKNVMLLFCADSSACLLFHIFFSLLLIALSPHTFFFFCSSRFSIRPNADFSAKIKEEILLCSKLCT